MNERFVSASELAEYAYCRRAWWLRAVRGETGEGDTERYEQGRANHRRAMYRLVLARVLLVFATFFAAIAVGLWIFRHP